MACGGVIDGLLTPQENRTEREPNIQIHKTVGDFHIPTIIFHLSHDKRKVMVPNVFGPTSSIPLVLWTQHCSKVQSQEPSLKLRRCLIL